MTRQFMETWISTQQLLKLKKEDCCVIKRTRGYNAVKVGFFKLKTSKLTKQMKAILQKKILNLKKFLKNLE